MGMKPEAVLMGITSIVSGDTKTEPPSTELRADPPPAYGGNSPRSAGGRLSLILAGKGRTTNHQNERGEEIRSSKYEIRGAGGSGKSLKRSRAGGPWTEGCDQGDRTEFPGLETDEFFFLLATGSPFLLIILVGGVFVVGCPIFILTPTASFNH